MKDRMLHRKKKYTTIKGQKLYKKAKSIIPGGTQLFSKRAELFAPKIWPTYFSRAKGCRVWDIDGNEYIDMSIMGVGANILGYADDDVDAAVIEAVKRGVSSSLNCPEEVDLAELLIKLHPWAQMVRFARSGGEAMAMAVRIARAATSRDLVFFSGYHGWTDWYLAANLGENDELDGHLMPGLEPNGIPSGLRGTAIPFDLNNIDELSKNIRGKENQIAAIIIEPARGEEARVEALLNLKDIASSIGAVLIFDEITSGFRMNAGGIHLRYGINPDIAVFAKSMANGYAMAAVIGVEKIMQAAQTTFISSTNWTERVGPVAAITTINKYMNEKVSAHIIKIGNTVRKLWKTKSNKYGIDIAISGLPTLLHFDFLGKYKNEMSTYFTIRMLDEGFLAWKQFKPSFAHSMKEITAYAEAVDSTFDMLRRKCPGELLKTPTAHNGFYRLTKE